MGQAVSSNKESKNMATAAGHVQMFEDFWRTDEDGQWKAFVKSYLTTPPQLMLDRPLNLSVHVVEYHLKPESNDEYALPVENHIDSYQSLARFLDRELPATLRGQTLLLDYDPSWFEWLVGSLKNLLAVFRQTYQVRSSASSYALASIGHKWDITGRSLYRLLDLGHNSAKQRARILSQRPPLLKGKEKSDSSAPQVHRIELAWSAGDYRTQEFGNFVARSRPRSGESRRSTVNVFHLDSIGNGKPWRALVTTGQSDVIQTPRSRFLIEPRGYRDDEPVKEKKMDVKLRVESPLYTLQEAIGYFMDHAYWELAKISSDLEKAKFEGRWLPNYAKLDFLSLNMDTLCHIEHSAKAVKAQCDLLSENYPPVPSDSLPASSGGALGSMDSQTRSSQGNNILSICSPESSGTALDSTNSRIQSLKDDNEQIISLAKGLRKFLKDRRTMLKDQLDAQDRDDQAAYRDGRRSKSSRR